MSFYFISTHLHPASSPISNLPQLYSHVRLSLMWEAYVCHGSGDRQRGETACGEEVEFSSCVADRRSAETAASLMWQQCTQQEQSCWAIPARRHWRELSQINLRPPTNTHIQSYMHKHTISLHNHSRNPLCQGNSLNRTGSNRAIAPHHICFLKPWHLVFRWTNRLVWHRFKNGNKDLVVPEAFLCSVERKISCSGSNAGHTVNQSINLNITQTSFLNSSICHFDSGKKNPHMFDPFLIKVAMGSCLLISVA